MDYSGYKSFLEELIAVSSQAILPWFARPGLDVESKADASPVTIADRSAEQAMRALIQRRHPTHGILGEEFGPERADAEFVWVLDPVDGTKSFITAVPLFVTLIGLLHHGRPVLGCIHQPVLGKTMVGDRHTTTLNGAPVRVRAPRLLGESTLLTSDPRLPAVHQNGAAYDQLVQRAGLYRSFGDGYGYLLVASGWADIMVDPIMNPWDILPLVPCLEGAGARITDWQGRPADAPGANSCVACAPGIHDQVLAILNG